MTTTSTELTPHARVVRRVAHALNSADPAAAALRRWTPGMVDPAVIGIVAEAPDDLWQAWASVASAMVRHHSSGGPVRYGYPGTGLGKALRQVGYSDEQALRTLKRLTDATSLDQLHTTIVAATELMRRAKTGAGRTSVVPHWETVLAEVETWTDPTTRDQARVGWARDFHTYIPRATDPAADPDTATT